MVSFNDAAKALPTKIVQNIPTYKNLHCNKNHADRITYYKRLRIINYEFYVPGAHKIHS